MANMKSLLRDTAIYGLSSIMGRFLNYLLVPLYTHCMPRESGDYGISTNVYAYVALILVFLTFGMETTLFRFANRPNEKADTVFSMAFLSVGALTALFLCTVMIFLSPISQALGYEDHPEYLSMMSIVVALDAIQALPFSWLRYKQRPIKFATLKLLFILLNVGLNCYYFLYLEITQVYYVFAINLACTAAITLFFLPDLIHIRWQTDFALLRRMLTYSWPLLVLGLAGILNQTIDKMIFPLLYTREDADVQLGIYGACVKIAMIMAMITQAFRYAYEPIVFAKTQDNDKQQYYAQAMKYFLIFTLLAFLCVMAWMPVLQHIIGAGYREGLSVVPIVMAAEIMMGVYFNLSFWYKLIDKTIYGAWFSLAGCAVLLLVNIWGIPRYGYMACAWGGFAGYAIAMTLSYVMGQRKYPIAYPLRDMLTYVVLCLGLFIIMNLIPIDWSQWARVAAGSFLVLIFVGHIISHDVPLRSIPIIGHKKHP